MMHFSVLDETDEKILNILLVNGRASYSDIAREIGLTGVAVRNRVIALENKGIIEGYSAIINPTKIEAMTSVYLDIQADIHRIDGIIDALQQESCITKVYLLSGPGKLHVHGLFNNNEELEQFLREKLYSMPGIVDVRCDIIFSRIKDSRGIRM